MHPLEPPAHLLPSKYPVSIQDGLRETHRPANFTLLLPATRRTRNETRDRGGEDRAVHSSGPTPARRARCYRTIRL